MFGKPEWFKEKTIGWGVVPVKWQGWGYTAIWSAVISGPFLTLLAMMKIPESLIWMALSVGALVLDVRSVVKQMRQKKERDALFYIGDEADSHVATKNFDLHVKE